MTRTFIDAAVMIAAWRGEEAISERALGVLDDPDREIVTSPFLELEVLPKAVFHKKLDEEAFFRAVLDKAVLREARLDLIIALAQEEACAHGLGAIDALHVAAARVAGAAEPITLERPTSPLLRVVSIRVVTIYAP